MSKPTARNSLLSRANEWLFGFGPTHLMAVLRILYGSLAFINFVMIYAQFDSWFAQRGFTPPVLSRIMFGDAWRINVFLSAQDDTSTRLIFLALIVVSFTTTIGFMSRISSILLAIGVISFHHRNGMILHGGDTMLRQMCIYLAFMQSGNLWSVDRWLALRSGKPDPALKTASVWPVRLVAIQVAIVYFTTVWHKWNGDYWRNGTATWYPMNLNEFSKFALPDFMFSEWFVRLTTYGTLATELALATLVFFKPFRKWVILAGLGMHGFIEYSMNIPLFAFIMVAAYVSFYEADEAAAFFERFASRRKGAKTAPASEAAHV